MAFAFSQKYSITRLSITDSNMLNEEKVPPWAKAYINMFRCQQASFKKEKDFNEMNSRKFPHCSICMLLQPRIVVCVTNVHN